MEFDKKYNHFVQWYVYADHPVGADRVGVVPTVGSLASARRHYRALPRKLLVVARQKWYREVNRSRPWENIECI